MTYPSVFVRCVKSVSGYRVLIEHKENRAKTWQGEGESAEQAWIAAGRNMLDDIETHAPNPEGTD